MGFIKIKNLCPAKDSDKKMKRQTTDWGEIFARQVSNKVSSKILRNSQNSTIKKKKIQLENGPGDFPGGPVVRNSPSNAGDAGSIPSQGIKIPHASEQLSLHAAATELTCLNYREARAPQLERSPRAAMKDPACLYEDPVCHH